MCVVSGKWHHRECLETGLVDQKADVWSQARAWKRGPGGVASAHKCLWVRQMLGPNSPNWRETLGGGARGQETFSFNTFSWSLDLVPSTAGKHPCWARVGGMALRTSFLPEGTVTVYSYLFFDLYPRPCTCFAFVLGF